jgi:predicted metal-dependent enzyme (double-stranded beta helix superfamily)
LLYDFSLAHHDHAIHENQTEKINMSPKILETFVEKARIAATSDTPSSSIRNLLKDSLSQSEDLADAIAAQKEDEVLLFEDETCSIWTCRFNTDEVLPPHEHCMPVHIAVYRGTEVEVLYKREKNQLKFGGNKHISACEVASLGTEAIHAITADGLEQSHAIHIYEGALTAVQRSLFAWDNGTEIEFTEENFQAMKRPKSDMSEFR